MVMVVANSFIRCELNLLNSGTVLRGNKQFNSSVGFFVVTQIFNVELFVCSLYKSRMLLL